MNYSVEQIKALLETHQFDELNRIIKLIMDKQNHDSNDLEIVNYLSNTDQISIESRATMENLADAYTQELQEAVAEAVNDPLESSPSLVQEEVLAEGLESDNQVGDIEVEQRPVDLNSDPSTIKHLKKVGLTVKGYSLGDNNATYITLEINNQSKPYIDNLMNHLYANENSGIGFDLTKLSTTKEEFFTVFLTDDQNLDINTRTDQMLEEIDNIVENTEKDRNYEEEMPSNVKMMKAQFNNDAYDLPDEDYRIWYTNFNGTDNFYMVTSSSLQAKKLTEEMGYQPREYVAEGVVEIDPGYKDLSESNIADASQTIGDYNQFKGQIEKNRVKTLGSRPYIAPRTDAAYVSWKTTALIVALTILVVISVTLMTIRG